jgi:hypothetical protein
MLYTTLWRVLHSYGEKLESARKPSILTDTFHGIAFSLEASAAVVPTVGYYHLITNYFKLMLHESDSVDGV